MKNVAIDVWQIDNFPSNSINAYLVGDILIDCGTRWDMRRFLKELAGVDLKLVALTHCHPDHQGAAKAVCERFEVPLACHELDRSAMEGRTSMVPDGPMIRISSKLFSGPPHKVDRVLQDGEMVGPLRVIHAPGHTPGHCMFFREEDRLLIAGDAVLNMNLLTLWPGLHAPPNFFCVDPAQNRRAIRRIGELAPRTVLFGHGPPLSDMRKLVLFLDRLPE